jgi:hypothetical protein
MNSAKGASRVVEKHNLCGLMHVHCRCSMLVRQDIVQCTYSCGQLCFPCWMLKQSHSTPLICAELEVSLVCRTVCPRIGNSGQAGKQHPHHNDSWSSRCSVRKPSHARTSHSGCRRLLPGYGVRRKPRPREPTGQECISGD